MHILHIGTGVDGYPELVRYVLRYGQRRSPRGVETYDIGPMTVIMSDVTESLPLGVGRNINRKIAAAEAFQLIGGISVPTLLLKASPNFHQFTEPDGSFYGAYGSRIGSQLSSVLLKLRGDRDTRRAVITLWDPQRDNSSGHNDYPCTVALFFALIDNHLEMTTTMRSQDVWLGTPFDWMQFTQLQQTIATALDVPVGSYRHITMSTHLYASNIPDVERLTDSSNRNSREWQPRGLGRSGDSGASIRQRMGHLLRAFTNDDDILSTLNESERWYYEQLSPLLG